MASAGDDDLNWHTLETVPQVYRSRYQDMSTPIFWDWLVGHAIEARRAKGRVDANLTCTYSAKMAFGGSSFVKRFDFSDGVRWAARIMHINTPVGGVAREVATMNLVREKTSIPVPGVYAWMEADAPENRVVFPWMLLEYIPFNSVCLEWPDNNSIVPPTKYWETHQRQVADHVIEMAALRFDKIGHIYRNGDSYEVGPIPNLGGPFDTPAAYFEALARRFKESPRPVSSGRLDWYPAEERDDIAKSYADFYERLAHVAVVCNFDTGPYPLVHTQMDKINTLIDDDCNIRALVDWKHAMTLPWEVAQFAYIWARIALEMRTGYNKDEWDSRPKGAYWTALDRFVVVLREAEQRRGLDHRVSEAMADHRRCSLAAAFFDHTTEYSVVRYHKVLELFE